MPRTRKSTPKKPLPPAMHIYCEGLKTEPYYIESFIQFFHPTHRNIVVVEQTNKNTPLQLVETAINAKAIGSENDVYWVVFDREAINKYPDKLHLEARQKADSAGINIGFSNICFELWLLMHFVSSNASYSNCDDLLKNSVLKNKLQDVGISKYDKALPYIFDRLKDKIPDAITNSMRINLSSIATASVGKDQPHHLNPYCDLFELFVDMQNFINKENSVRKRESDDDKIQNINETIEYFKEKLKIKI